MIYVANQTRGSGLDARALAATVERLLTEIGEAGSSVSLTLVRDRAMRELNREHRGIDEPTAREAFRLAGHKLPVGYKFLTRGVV